MSDDWLRFARQFEEAEDAHWLEAFEWHCQDHTDEWISFPTEAEAVEYQKETGCLLRIVYRPIKEGLSQ